MKIKVAVLTISDSCAEGSREDVSGQTIIDMLPVETFEVCEKKIVADDHEEIVSVLKSFSDEQSIDVVLTTGGTGLGPRDVTPEATASVCERMAPGFSEILRVEGFRKTSKAILSRGVAGMRKNSLIVNLPGSPKAVRECLEIILDVIPHAVKMIRGGGH
ncbi:MAG: MogA/MoaB family molybdenum cofactor biosynthesis protein [Planctomycetes bacterium]|nr:MogA/MoaB family molybdenum cofactor biosynthesis protein [Planctomycetota bacterium]MBL7143133.1 MogA/MoaB family molybdenum cofactor biosynthesis protein [Phycisphaerae bacterium]